LACTLLYLVRHAEQDSGSGAGDDAGTGLSALGEQQARHLGQRLAAVPFDVIRHSPLRRAERTAQILGSHLPGVPVVSSDLLRDRTPVPSAGQAATVPPPYRAFLGRVPADERDLGGERLNAAFAQLAVTAADDRYELLVTHNFVIGWFIRHVLDAPPWRWIGLNQFNAALTIIQIESGLPPMLISFNDIGHLPIELRGRTPIALRS
jgi:serine/threonine-protein phosphatase PGAM5